MSHSPKLSNTSILLFISTTISPSKALRPYPPRQLPSHTHHTTNPTPTPEPPPPACQMSNKQNTDPPPNYPLPAHLDAGPYNPRAQPQDPQNNFGPPVPYNQGEYGPPQPYNQSAYGPPIPYNQSAYGPPQQYYGPPPQQQGMYYAPQQGGYQPQGYYADRGRGGGMGGGMGAGGGICAGLLAAMACCCCVDMLM